LGSLNNSKEPLGGLNCYLKGRAYLKAKGIGLGLKKGPSGSHLGGTLRKAFFYLIGLWDIGWVLEQVKHKFMDYF